MSDVVKTNTFLYNSALGNVAVTVEEVSGFDVEDIIRDRSFSQAMAIQFLNIGKEVDQNATQTKFSLPSIFTGNIDEELIE